MTSINAARSASAPRSSFIASLAVLLLEPHMAIPPRSAAIAPVMMPGSNRITPVSTFKALALGARVRRRRQPFWRNRSRIDDFDQRCPICLSPAQFLHRFLSGAAVRSPYGDPTEKCRDRSGHDAGVKPYYASFDVQGPRLGGARPPTPPTLLAQSFAD